MNQLKMGFTLIELLISALIISFISGSIIYGIVLTDRSLRNEALKEFAFIGRSNVGKSSLINMLFDNKNLAKTSKKPGTLVSVLHGPVHTGISGEC